MGDSSRALRIRGAEGRAIPRRHSRRVGSWGDGEEGARDVLSEGRDTRWASESGVRVDLKLAECPGCGSGNSAHGDCGPGGEPVRPVRGCREDCVPKRCLNTGVGDQGELCCLSCRAIRRALARALSAPIHARSDRTVRTATNSRRVNPRVQDAFDGLWPTMHGISVGAG